MSEGTPVSMSGAVGCIYHSGREKKAVVTKLKERLVAGRCLWQEAPTVCVARAELKRARGVEGSTAYTIASTHQMYSAGNDECQINAESK
jgi:hypothetical protein